MKQLNHKDYQHIQYCGKKYYYQLKKNNQILQKMANLEKKLNKYDLGENEISDDVLAESNEDGNFRSRSRSHDKGIDYYYGMYKHKKHCAPGRSKSANSHVPGATSSRLPSLKLRKDSRSKYFGNHSLNISALDTKDHHHQHQLIPLRYLGSSRRHRKNLKNFISSLSKEDMLVNTTDDDIEVPQNECSIENTTDAPEMNEVIATKWSEINQKGLPEDTKKYLLKKYRISKNCYYLKAPKINHEILSVLTKIAIQRDSLLMVEQDQIGTGLNALGQSISNLCNKFENNKDENIGNILDTIKDAADILVQAYYQMTETRKIFLLKDVNKKNKRFFINCKINDEYLHENAFGEKFEDIKVFHKQAQDCKNSQFGKQYRKGKNGTNYN